MADTHILNVQKFRAFLFVLLLADIPYTRLSQADADQEYLNFGELNELGILSQSNSFNLCDIGAAQSAPSDLITSPAKTQIMYQSIQQPQYEHQLQANQMVVNQPYAAPYQNHHHFAQNYEPVPDDHFYHHSQMYAPQQSQSQQQHHHHHNQQQQQQEQQLQNQLYYPINLQNGFSDIEYVFKLNIISVG